jgi:hypothetical protein
MEPLNDEQLKEILGEWHAPKASADLEARVLAPRHPWWMWLLTGSVSVPVPVLVAALLLAALAAFVYSARKSDDPVGLANFQPVKQLNVRIIRSNYEPR